LARFEPRPLERNHFTQNLTLLSCELTLYIKLIEQQLLYVQFLVWSSGQVVLCLRRKKSSNRETIKAQRYKEGVGEEKNNTRRHHLRIRSKT